MIKSSITISLVSQAEGGPFIFWHDLAGSCRIAASLNFDAVEIFAPSATSLDRGLLRSLLKRNKLSLSALGTGAGFVLHHLSLCDPDPSVRREAAVFISAFIELAGSFGAPVIIGSMQGSVPAGTDRALALQWLSQSLDRLAPLARSYNVPLLFEPLNRNETNLVNRLDQGVELIKALRSTNVRLLADLFHLSIEHSSIPQALRDAGGFIGYIHLVDNNRRAAGLGSIDFAQVADALVAIGYNGYVSAEALPWPDPESAAVQTMKVFKQYIAPD